MEKQTENTVKTVRRIVDDLVVFTLDASEKNSKKVLWLYGKNYCTHIRGYLSGYLLSTTC